MCPAVSGEASLESKDNDQLLEEIAALRRELAQARAQVQPVNIDRAHWLAGILALSSDVISILDREGRVLYINRAEPITTVADALGKLATDYLPPDQHAALRDAFARAWSDGEPQQIEVVSHGDYWWSTRIAPIREDGQTVCLLAIASDITERKRAEQALTVKEHQLKVALEGKQRAQRLEALGQLAGGVAHDFNNLLVAIMGNIQVATLRDKREERAACLDEALEACTRAAELTKQLLAFGRRQPIHEQLLDVHAMLDDTLRFLRRLVPESIAIELHKAPTLARVLGDRGQLEQVVVNLCINARDAMPHGGRLSITTEEAALDGKLRESHPWVRPGRYVRLSVTDTGSGIDAELLERIFEPFFTTKELGSGLGLSSVYGIVKQHGGLVHVQSALSKGSTFRVYLPIAERSAREAESKPAEPVRGGTETILLAEDEAGVRKVVALILSEAGYKVIEAVNGAQAVELFQASKDIAIVLLDAVMPQKSGTQAAQEIRALRPDVRVILSSGYSDLLASDPTALADLEFLAKPYEPDTLLRTIRRLLDKP